MNAPLRKAHPRRSGAPASGFVLVTVLIVLVLLVVLVVAFLLRVTTERTSSTGFRGSASARELADMAVGLVQGQISLAAAQEPTNVWCSQPGMVRTYDSSGNFYNAFKLYSSTNMVVTAATGLGISGGVSPDAPPAAWAGSPAFWTDLNAPVQSPSGTNVYPIVDPGATNTATGVSGFTVTSPPGATTSQPFPMAVRWLYVLADGSLVAPTGSGSTATVAGANSTDKKIVGRIAFWTDDNTCRVNINTASAGTFWDVPRGYSTNASGVPTSGSLTQEQAYGYYQPVQKEFQRYPGHPAMTDIRAVFTNATPAQIYNIVPRIVGGGSTQGTVVVAAGSTLTGYPRAMPNSRLYANVDELLFQGDHKTPNTPVNATSTAITPAQLEAAKFFLTAQSRAPELNLFGLPRVACWPINADYDPVNKPTSPYTTAFDRLIAFCSTTDTVSGGSQVHPYYFQRQNALSTTNDISITRNQALYGYLQYLTSQSIPGFSTAGATFLSKYPSPGGGLPSDRDQILTEIFDYIRCTNLYDDTLDTTPGEGKYEFTGTGVTGSSVNAKGCVVPSVNGTATGTTTVPMGFGRYYTMSQLGIAFICNADGNGTNIITVNGVAAPAPNNVAPTGARWPYSGPQPPAAMNTSALPNLDDYQKRSNTATTLTYSMTDPSPYNSLTVRANRVLGGTPLSAGQKYVQAILIPEFYSVMHGFVALYPYMQISMSGLSNLQLNGQQLFPNDTEGPISYHDVRADGAYPPATGALGADYSTATACVYGANPGWRYFGLGSNLAASPPHGAGRIMPTRGNMPGDPGSGSLEPYPFVSNPIIIPDKSDGAGTMSLTSSGDITVTISAKDPVSGTSNTVQTLKISLPGATLPTPSLVVNNFVDTTDFTTGTTTIKYTGLICTTLHNGTESPTMPESWWSFDHNGAITDGHTPAAGIPSVLSNIGTTVSVPGRMGNIGQPIGQAASSGTTTYAGVFLWPKWDVLRTVFPQHGDFRLVAGRSFVPDTVFQPHRYYSDLTKAFASDLSNSFSTGYDPGYDTAGQYISTITSAAGHEPEISPVSGTPTPEATGDYDDSLPDLFPGPLINKPNEGSLASTSSTSSIPYYSNAVQSTANSLGGVDTASDGGAFFSPNRMMPSPGMFGSLPSGIMAGKPWQTLLFRPQASHPGAANPPDHLLLDLFWMPVVEPYAISDRFSTAGKINMNYQILPFTYMKRQTGLYALFQSEKVTAIPNGAITKYKVPTTIGGGYATPLRYSIDAAATLSASSLFETKFSSGDVFKSASEICSVDIVPDGGALGTTPGVNTVANMDDFTSAGYWPKHALTGDNDREHIYTTLYPRLTTKSNTYTVYFTAQSLKQASTSTPGTWTEGVDTVQGEYRGSAVVERFIDANNGSIPDYAADATTGTITSDAPLDSFYRWRVISNRQFAP